MTKSLIALVAASSVAVAAVCTASTADALGGGAGGGGSAFSAGHARPDYGHPYYGYRYLTRFQPFVASSIFSRLKPCCIYPAPVASCGRGFLVQAEVVLRLNIFMLV
jgi:hypothetical protein